MSSYRVLAIPFKKDRDEDGRCVGTDWLLASMGEDMDGTKYYVTTDGVHASECGSLPVYTAKEAAEFLVKKLNELEGGNADE